MTVPLAPDSDPRKKFSPQEDAKLLMLVAQFGPLAWDPISREMPNRNPRQCRERWKHYLSVGFADRPWTKAEDDLLLKKRQELGPRWTKLSQFFQNRSDIQIKARWLKLTDRPPPPQHDVDVVCVKQPGMLFDQFTRSQQAEKEWEALFGTHAEAVCRNSSEWSWF
jgi:hypothetical protein